MLKSRATTIIKRDLGFREGIDDDILRELQDAQDEFESLGVPSRWGNFWPWFLVTENATAFTVPGDERVPLPEDFLMEVEESQLWWLDSSAEVEEKWKPLEKGEVEDLRVKYPGSGDPKAYALDNKYFRIFPEPEESRQLSMSYFGRAKALTEADTENDWLKFAPSLMIGRAGERLAKTLRDDKALSTFQDRYLVAVDALFRANEERKHAGKRYVIGDTRY